MRSLLLVLGLILLALAGALLLAYEGRPPALGRIWAEWHVASLNGLQAGVERYLWPPLWDELLFPVLRQRADLVLGVLGGLLVLLSRRARR